MVSERMYRVGEYIGITTGVLGAIGATIVEAKGLPSEYLLTCVCNSATGWLSALGLRGFRSDQSQLDELLTESA